MTTATVPSPPELKTLRLDVDGEIGTLTLDRPKSLNAMSPELIGELVTAASWLADRAPLRALIVAEVVPRDTLMQRVHEKAERLAAKAPHYVRMSKLLVGRSLENTLADHLQLERHGIADSMATEDLREGVTAFLEDREATFTGR